MLSKQMFCKSYGKISLITFITEITLDQIHDKWHWKWSPVQLKTFKTKIPDIWSCRLWLQQPICLQSHFWVRVQKCLQGQPIAWKYKGNGEFVTKVIVHSQSKGLWLLWGNLSCFYVICMGKSHHWIAVSFIVFHNWIWCCSDVILWKTSKCVVVKLWFTYASLSLGCE